MKHNICPKCEDTFVAAYRKAEAAYDALQKQAEAYYLPLARAKLAAGDLAGARAVRQACPDHVTQVFIYDAIRQKELGK